MHWLEDWIIPPKCVLTNERAVSLDLSPSIVTGLKHPEQSARNVVNLLWIVCFAVLVSLKPRVLTELRSGFISIMSWLIWCMD